MECRVGHSVVSGVWDARAALAVGVIVTHFLHVDPPPPESRLGADLEVWAGELMRLGEDCVAGLGVRRLRGV